MFQQLQLMRAHTLLEGRDRTRPTMRETRARRRAVRRRLLRELLRAPARRRPAGGHHA
jgi:hypothetical protein